MLAPSGDTDVQLQDQAPPCLQVTDQGGGLSGAVLESFSFLNLTPFL